MALNVFIWSVWSYCFSLSFCPIMVYSYVIIRLTKVLYNLNLMSKFIHLFFHVMSRSNPDTSASLMAWDWILSPIQAVQKTKTSYCIFCIFLLANIEITLDGFTRSNVFLRSTKHKKMGLLKSITFSMTWRNMNVSSIMVDLLAWNSYLYSIGR